MRNSKSWPILAILIIIFFCAALYVVSGYAQSSMQSDFHPTWTLIPRPSPTDYPTQEPNTPLPSQAPLTLQPAVASAEFPDIATQIASDANAIANLVSKKVQPPDNTLTIVGLILGVLGPILVVYVKGRTDSQLAVLRVQYESLKGLYDAANLKITALEADNKKLEDQRFDNIAASQEKLTMAVAAGVAMATAPYDELFKQQNAKIASLQEEVTQLKAAIESITKERDVAQQALKQRENETKKE